MKKTYVTQGNIGISENITATHNEVEVIAPISTENTSLSQVLIELKNLKDVIETNNTQHKKMVGKLTEEIITLRNEVRQLKSTKESCILDDGEQHILPKFPLNTLDELLSFDDNLKSNELLVKQMVNI